MSTTAALESSREVLSLRRYLRERAAGRAAAEWAYLNPDLRVWLAADEATATALGRDIDAQWALQVD